jgi:hypothetical protein
MKQILAFFGHVAHACRVADEHHDDSLRANQFNEQQRRTLSPWLIFIR